MVPLDPLSSLPDGFEIDEPMATADSAATPPEGFELDDASGDLVGAPSTRDRLGNFGDAPKPPQRPDLSAPSWKYDRTEPKLINGKWYMRVKRSGAIVELGEGSSPRPIDDPKILAEFGKTAPTKEAQLQIRRHDALNDETTWKTDLETGWYNLRQGVETAAFVGATEALKQEGDEITGGLAGFKIPRSMVEKAQGKALTGIAEFKGKSDAMPKAPVMERFNNSKTWGEAWSNFAADPYTVARSTVLQSAPSSMPSVVGGIVGSVIGPLGAAGGAGAGSYITELGDSIGQGLEEHGADLTDPESVKKVWREHGRAIMQKANVRAAVIGAVDAATGGATSKLVEQPAKSLLGEVGRDLVGTGIQMAGGAGGEAAAEVATGDPLNPAAILGEAIGEFGSGAVEVAGQSAVGAVKSARGTKADRLDASPEETPPAGFVLDDKPAAPAPAAAASGERPALGKAPWAPGSRARETLPEGYTIDDEEPSAAPVEKPVAEASDEDFDAALKAGVRAKFETYLDLKERADAGDTRAREDLPEAEQALIEDFRIAGLPGDSMERGPRAINSVDDIIAAFDQASPKEREAYWMGGNAPPRAATIDIKAARAEVAPEPSEPQKLAGNYRKGHVKVHGLDITIETARGQKRTGKDASGQEWSVKMADDYGYVKRTTGADGEQVDVFLGPDLNSEQVFVIDQVDPDTKAFDEHKVVIGADNETEARSIYERGYSDGKAPTRIGGIKAMSVPEFKAWLEKPQTKPAATHQAPAPAQAPSLASPAPTEAGVAPRAPSQPAEAQPQAEAETARADATSPPPKGERPKRSARPARAQAPAAPATDAPAPLSLSAPATPQAPKSAQLGIEGGRAVVDAWSPTKNYLHLGQFRPSRRKTLAADAGRYVVKQGKVMDGEAILIFTGDGTVVADGSGAARSVGWPPAAAELFLDPKADLVVHHNHPSSTSLSIVDVAYLAFPGLKVVWAHGNAANVFRASLPPAIRRLDPDAIARTMWRARKAAEAPIYDELQKRILEDKLSPPDASALHAHLSNQALHNIGLIDCYTDYSPDLTTLGDVLQRATEAARATAESIIDADALAKARGPDRSAVAFRHIGDMGISSPYSGGPAPGRISPRRVDRRGKGRDRQEAKRLAPSGLEEDRGPIFYSVLLRTVENLKQAKAPAAQWLGMIRNAPGVKKEELDWIGLEDWLNSQMGPITRVAVAEFIRANQVQVQEVVQGGKPARRDDIRPTETAAAPFMEEWNRNVEEIRRIGEERGALLYRDPKSPMIADLHEQREGLERRQDALHEQMVDATIKEIGGLGKPTKFGEYTLPGGDSYREFLLTLPSSGLWGAKAAEAANNLRHELFRKYGNGIRLKATRDEIARLDDLDDRSTLKGPSEFRSSHFDTPNILAHVRFNERADAEGKRVLFIEEVQSDWHQAGRRKGYRGKEPYRGRSTSEISADMDADLAELDRREPGVEPSYEQWERHPDLLSRHQRLQEEYNAAHQAEEPDGNNTVPDAPFKTTWPELAMKRMIRWAADNGFDRIAWTPGDVQADRYDLSKQIDSILYSFEDGKYWITAEKDGRAFHGLDNEPLTESQLADTVGKEIADRIVSGEGKAIPGGPEKSLSGPNLKIGGERMQSFYDRELVNIANKLGKKFGSKAGQTTIRKDADQTAYDMDGMTQEDHDNAKARDVRVHSLDITPEMRAAAMRGQPLFKVTASSLQFSPTAYRRRADIANGIQQVARRILGHRIPVEILDRINDKADQGQYNPNSQSITIALRDAMRPFETLGHEIIHALRDIGVITDKEWSILREWAARDLLPNSNIREIYSDLYRDRFDIDDAQLEELLIEEAIAEAFGAFVENKLKGDAPRSILSKIRNFLTGLRNMLRGLGFQTAEDIFASIERGDVIGRSEGQSARGFELYMRQGTLDQAAPVAVPGYLGETQSKLIDDILAGDRPDRPIVFREIPRVLEALGVKKTPLVMPANIVWKAVATHGLTPSQLKAAIDELSDPVMVFDSATEPDAVTVLVNAPGETRPVVVAIHFDKKVGRIEVSMIASIHPRHSDRHVTNWVDQGLTRYINQRKTDAWVRSRGLQLSKGGSPKHRAGKKILRWPDVFKSPEKGSLSNVQRPEPLIGDPFDVAKSVEARDDLADIASNINLDYLAAPDDIKKVISDVSERSAHFIGARRGVITNEQTRELAADLGMTVADLQKRRHGQAFNAENIFAARVLLVKSATRVRELAAKAKKTEKLADLAEFQKAFTRHVAIQEQVAGLAAEAGRALQQFKMMAGDNFYKGAKDLVEIARAKNPDEPFGKKNKFGKDAVLDLAEMVDALDDPAAINRFSRDTYRVTIGNMIREAWINALLSGLRTHTTNILSNTLTALWQVPETAVAAAIGAMHGGEKVQFREASARLVGLIEGAGEGLRAGATAFRTGEPSDLGSKIESHRTHAIPGIAGEIIRIPSRALLAEDEVFKAVNYRAEINAQAVRIAMAEGRRGQSLAARIAELRANPTQAMKTEAHKAALYNTFQNDLGAIGKTVMRMRESIPGAWIILPFIKTPANIIKYAAERSPFGLLMQDVRDNLRGKNGNIARDTQYARMFLGTSLGISVAMMVGAGLISGGGPDDPDERKLLLAKGWQPYSVNIGGTWYSYQRLDPLGFMLGVSADLVELGEAVTSAEADKVGAMIVSSISGNLLEKTWLRGIGDLIQAVQDPERYGEYYIRGLAGTLIPTGVAQVAQAIDPVMRDARDIVDVLKSRTPGKSQELMPRRNIFGEEIRRQGALGPDLISPIFSSTEKDDPVIDAMLELHFAPAMPRREINGHQLTPEQYDEYVEMAGKAAKKELDRKVGLKSWTTKSPDEQTKFIRDAFNDAREDARKKMKRKYRELRKKK